jgi:hypothetical protein
MRSERPNHFPDPSGCLPSRLAGGAAVAGAEGLTVVEGERALRRMVDHLLDPTRVLPVVALTPALGTGEPVIAPASIRFVVGADAHVYFVVEEDLLPILARILGRSLALQASSARVWWPALSARSDAAAHPLVFFLDGQSEQDALAEFSRQFDLSRPDVRRQITVIEDASAFTTHTATELAAQRLRDLRLEYDRVHTRAEQAEAALKAAAQAFDGMECEEQLHLLIAREWRETLTAELRRAYPPGRYVLSAKFVAQVEQQTAVEASAIAWACAMTACGYAQTLAGLWPMPRLIAGTATQIQRDDGATGWRCNVIRDTPLSPHLDYWVYGPLVMFDGIG